MTRTCKLTASEIPVSEAAGLDIGVVYSDFRIYTLSRRIMATTPGPRPCHTAGLRKDISRVPDNSGEIGLREGGWLDRAEKRMRAIPPSRRALFIALVGVLILGTLIAVDNLFLNQALTDAFGRATDLNFYRERAQAVLDGKVLYRDIAIESPPLIVYLYIPAQLAGGSDLAYQIWFGAFTILTALTLYWGLRRFDDYRAFMVGLLFITSPIAAIETAIGIQDEAIVFFLFVVAAVLAINNSDKLSTLAATVGTWVKVFPALFYPVLFLRTKAWRDRLKQIGIIAVVSLIISAPFLVLCPVQFLQFPLYYFGISGGGDGNVTSPVSGISVWDYLRTAGVDIPGIVLLVLTLSAYVFALWWGRRKGCDIWKGTLLVLVAFVIFYSRMWVGYFLLPLIFIFPFGAENARIAVRGFLLALPLFFTLLFTSDNPKYVPIIDIPYAWLIGLLLTLLALWILVDTTRLVLKRDCFIHRRSG